MDENEMIVEDIANASESDETTTPEQLAPEKETVTEKETEKETEEAALFFGRGYSSVDDKSRLKIPADLRSQIGNRKFCLAQGPGNVIYLYTKEVANAKLKEIYDRFYKSGARPSPEAKKVIKSFVSSFTKVIEEDGQGRFNIPQWIMDWGGIKRRDQLVTIGALDHMEIRKAEAYKMEEEDVKADPKLQEEIFDDFGIF